MRQHQRNTNDPVSPQFITKVSTAQAEKLGYGIPLSLATEISVASVPAVDKGITETCNLVDKELETIFTHLPLPLCMHCHKPVEVLRISVEEKDFKFTVNCHGGHEFVRINKLSFLHSVENNPHIKPHLAFDDTRYDGILQRQSVRENADSGSILAIGEIVQVGLVDVTSENVFNVCPTTS